jgi:hypothetical protein
MSKAFATQVVQMAFDTKVISASNQLGDQGQARTTHHEESWRRELSTPRGDPAGRHPVKRSTATRRAASAPVQRYRMTSKLAFGRAYDIGVPRGSTETRSAPGPCIVTAPAVGATWRTQCGAGSTADSERRQAGGWA